MFMCLCIGVCLCDCVYVCVCTCMACTNLLLPLVLTSNPTAKVKKKSSKTPHIKSQVQRLFKASSTSEPQEQHYCAPSGGIYEVTQNYLQFPKKQQRQKYTVKQKKIQFDRVFLHPG